MKQISLSIIFCLLFSFTKAQKCDTIHLKNGTKYYGVLKHINKTTFSITRCDSLNKPEIRITKSDLTTIGRPSYKDIVDTIPYFHIGAIPYQLFTRSSGLYVGYDLKNKSSIEYRASYTYATNVEPSEFITLFYNDNFYFQGINNSVLFYFRWLKRSKIGLVLTYKHWWHGKQSIYSDNSTLSGKDEEFNLAETKSTVMNGFSLGIEFLHPIKTRRNFEFDFFYSAALTYFNSHSHVYSMDYLSGYYPGNPSVPTNYPYYETKNRIYFNVTAGFKIGYRKPNR